MTRTELIADLRLNHEYCPKEVILLAADMLEADAINDDLTIAYMSGFKAGEDKYKKAARLALDALEIAEKHLAYVEITEAIAALEEVLK